MLSCNLLHKKDNARIQNKRFCSEEGVEVPWSEVAPARQESSARRTEASWSAGCGRVERRRR
jgi:hypothetical protein